MNVYFSGIGGVGIGPLAEIALDAGYSVQGSDASEGLITQQLRERGITLSSSQDGSFLRECHEQTPIDWLVYTAALPQDHPELLLAKQLGIKTAKRDELLAHIIAERKLKLIAVAGTHGKTTTTGMLVWALKQLGVPVSYSVGTTLSWGPSGAFDPASEYFVYECDEFDRNFLAFHPHLSIVTSTEYDHPDTYPTEASYKTAFQQFIDQSTHTVIWRESDDFLELDTNQPVWSLDASEALPSSLMPLPGEHNRRNATLVVKALEYLDIGHGSTKRDSVATFPGTNRRFEKLAENLYSDYGHTPTEVAATLQLASELSSHVVLVYQPHQNIRQHEVRDQYTDDIFQNASEIYWLPTYQSREDPSLAILSPAELTRHLTRSATISDMNDDLWNHIKAAQDVGKLVLCMGAGSIDSWLRKCESVGQVANTLLVDNNKNLIMQQRDNKPDIINPGMITGFGGAVNHGESVRQAAARELREETNINFESVQLRYLATIHQTLPTDGSSRYVTFFYLENVDSSNIKVYEGEGFAIINSENHEKMNLSSTARQAVDLYFSKIS